MRRLDSITNSMTGIQANSRRQWRTEKAGVLRSVGWQRVGHDLASEQRTPVCYIILLLVLLEKDLSIFSREFPLQGTQPFF